MFDYWAVMGQKLPPEQLQLYRRVDEVLHYLWDPIGIAGTPEARDEYHSYLPHVFSLVVERAPESKIGDYLLKIETENMGFSPTPQATERAKRVTSILVRYRDFMQ